MQRPNMIIRMGAANWDARVRTATGWTRFDFRSMDKKQRSTFHREFMNAFRSARQEAA